LKKAKLASRFMIECDEVGPYAAVPKLKGALDVRQGRVRVIDLQYHQPRDFVTTEEHIDAIL
jgi:hypothetical protein